MQTAIALLAVVILGACAPRAASPPGVLQRSLEGEEIELRALLLLLGLLRLLRELA